MIISVSNIFCLNFLTTGLIQETTSSQEQQELGPILEPDPIQFSFDTPGWYILGFLIFLAIILLSIRWIKQYKNNTYRREAIKELNQINPSGSANELGPQLSQLLVILKMVALKAYGRENVATLDGKPWLVFLESKAKNTPFSKFETIISNSIYKNLTPEAKDLNELKNVSIKWIQTHA